MARSSIGQAVRARRRERDMTQEELAASVGVVPTYVNAIECDRRRSVTLDKLHSVVRSLGCRLELVEDGT
ncbi:MAG TPA: helix-turn-helix transcriptional regulator [Lacunisphaera sp.]|nr:helix-turn-helix transcriptional regulator [Lacunisphaera sp.]